MYIYIYIYIICVCLSARQRVLFLYKCVVKIVALLLDSLPFGPTARTLPVQMCTLVLVKASSKAGSKTVALVAQLVVHAC